MKRLLLLIAFALPACGKPASPAVTFTTSSIDLPDAVATFPATPGGEALTINCTACHSPEMILNQPVLGAEKWQATIDKMRTVYKAHIATDQDAILISALTGLEGKRPSTPSP